MYPPPRKAGPLSFFWALAPLFTCGFATPFTIAFAAVRRRSAWLAASAVLYAACVVAWISIVNAYEPEKIPEGQSALIAVGMLGAWIGGTIQSLVIREQVFAPRPDPSTPNERALALARQRRTLRDQARELAQSDPSLARELRVGRPDLPRQYDDGGLVDLNHAPPHVVAGLPGMTPQLVGQILRARETVGCFVSAEDVSAAASLPPHLTSELAEYTVYLP
ncbi:helix-hairpin-helix domain-containing protein [Microbispora sp. NPDC049125]|uniref:helix-hairpin-helix domain-containing protein n=1 Tax=Microbispora sp. NPDC049125 TaxID=3154929 RepID=UPI00346703D1